MDTKMDLSPKDYQTLLALICRFHNTKDSKSLFAEIWESHELSRHEADAVVGVSDITSGCSSFAEDARRRLGLCVLCSSPEALTSDRSGPSCFSFPIPHRRTRFF